MSLALHAAVSFITDSIPVDSFFLLAVSRRLRQIALYLKLSPAASQALSLQAFGSLCLRPAIDLDGSVFSGSTVHILPGR